MESKNYRTVALIAIIAFLNQQHEADAEPIANGPNVCNHTVPVKKNVVVEEPIEYKISYQTLCGLLPCTKTRTETKMDSRLETTIVEKEVPGCCPGYAETPDKHCAPICLDSCNNGGKCIKPGLCKCSPEPTWTTPGYVGPSCNRFVCLATDKWGSNCDRDCNCPPNSYCSGSTGKCLCRAGWRGANCTEECDLSTNCVEFTLPEIVDPELNVISDSIGRSQRMQALGQGPLEQESENMDSTHRASICYLYIILSVTCCCLFVLAMYYRQRLREVRNQIYASYASSISTSRNSGDYIAPSTYSYNGSNQNTRPRMPTPPESDYLSKNLSFDSATRNIIIGTNQEPQMNGKETGLGTRFLLLAPKVESHLMASKLSSEKNLYSDMASHPLSTSSANLIPKNGEQSSLLEDHDYQVPRSAAMRQVCLEDPSSQSQSPYENDNSSNIYEEIKPRDHRSQ